MKTVKFHYTEYFSQYTGNRETRYTDLSPKVNPIPGNSIIYKSITGIGATYSEFEARRHSIIMLPHISIIKSKQAYHKAKHNSFAVYNKVTSDEIFEYLKQNKGYAKILTTPKGLTKIEQAVGRIGLNIYKDFFLLIDESHKQTRDAQYREDMIPPLKEFFSFDNKAMVSATPLPPSDPRFIEQEFRNILIKPDFDYSKKIKLVHSNGLVNTFTEIIQEYSEDNFYIFFNSVEGIKSIIKSLEIANESTLFCSKENESLLKKQVNFSVHSEFSTLYSKKYNFFTSSFYNGLDITLDDKPNLIILTDVGFADFSMVDPFTDVIQIMGRLRNGYKHAIHINNATKRTNPISEEEAERNVKLSEAAYKALSALQKSYTGEKDNNFIGQLVERMKPYFNLLLKGEFSWFKYDNYMMEERIKRYYRSARSLWNAYQSTNLYVLSEDRRDFEKMEVEHLAHASKKYSKSNVQSVVEQLMAWEGLQGTLEYEKYVRELEQMFPVITEAYFQLGPEEIQAHNWNIKAITKELIKKDIQQKKNSTAFIEFLYLRFKLNIPYLCKDIKPAIQKIYEELDIKATAFATDVEDFFYTKEYFKTIDGKRVRGYILTDYKFNILQKYKRA